MDEDVLSRVHTVFALIGTGIGMVRPDLVFQISFAGFFALCMFSVLLPVYHTYTSKPRGYEAIVEIMFFVVAPLVTCSLLSAIAASTIFYLGVVGGLMGIFVSLGLALALVSLPDAAEHVRVSVRSD